MTTETETLTKASRDAALIEEPEPILRRARRISEDDVRQAADALLVDGDRPTVERVRARLGRGSPNTIALFLDRWWSQLGARLRDLPGQELPSVPEPVANALLSLWNEAIEQARTLLRESLAGEHADVAAQRTALDAQRADLERAQVEFVRERAALEQTVTLAQQQLAEANERHRADVARLDELQRESARLAEQLQIARREAAEGAARFDAARQGYEVERRTLQERLDGTEQHWMKQVDEARQALSAEHKRRETTERQYAGELTRLREALQVAHADRAQLEMQFVQTREALVAARADCEQLRAAAQKQEIRADDALKSLQSAQGLAAEQFEALQKQLHDVFSRSGRLEPPVRRQRLRVSSDKSDCGEEDHN